MIIHPIKIRALRKTDVKTLAKLIKTMAAYFGDTAKVKESNLLAQCFGSRKISEILLAFAANHPVGFIIAHDWMNFYLGIKIRHISFLFVQKEYQHSGIGSALMKAVAQKAVKAECQCLSLDVRKNNKIAIELYKKFGFKKRKSDTAHYRLYQLQNSSLARRTSNKI